MLVDIIIPAHNPGPYLKDALNSCIAQKYKNYKVTVVDDNSSEDIRVITDKFPDVNYIRNDKNLGPSGARNVAIKNTSGELISMLDADDIMHPRKLKLSVAEFQKSDEIGMTCGNYRILVNRSRMMRPFYRRPIDISYDLLMKQNYVASGSVTMRRSAVEDVGLFDEKYWISEDYDMWLRISEKYPIKYIDNILYYYSVIPKGGSLTQRDDIQKDHTKNIDEIRSRSKQRVSNR